MLQPPPPSSGSSANADPLEAIYNEISNLKHSLFHLLGSSHPSLDTIAKYYFHTEGKHLRPLLVLLMAQATNGLAGREWEEARYEAARQKVDDSLTRDGGVLNDWNPEMMGAENGTTTFAEPFRICAASSSRNRNRPPIPDVPALDELESDGGPVILPTQRRLASVTEMIHVASLLHDDVIDTSPLRRGQPSAPSAFGSKMSILGGDFLLGRASVALARLGSREVVELLSTVIANLVEGEVMQLRATSEPELAPSAKGFEVYMRKTYLKTASLMAKSARGAVILGGCGRGPTKEAEWVKDVAYGYGRNIGIAFQVSRQVIERRLRLTGSAHRRYSRLCCFYFSWKTRRRCRSQVGARDRTCTVRMGAVPSAGTVNRTAVLRAGRRRGGEGDGQPVRRCRTDTRASEEFCGRGANGSRASARERREGGPSGPDEEGRR